MKRIDDIGKRDPFRVPGGYFETLSEKIIDNAQKNNVSMPEEKSEKTVFMRMRPMLYLAAAVFGIAVISYSVIKFSHKSSAITSGESVLADAMIEEVDTYTIESEIMNSSAALTINEDSFSESLMLENIDETDITANNK